MKKKYIINISLLVSFSLITIIFCEFIARIFFKPFPLKFVPSNDKQLVVKDEMRRYRLNPGSVGFFQSNEFNYKVCINDYGFRDIISTSANYLKQSENKKIFIIGDSFAFGSGVNYENSIPGKVNHYINKLPIEDFNVINLGTPSYSLQQYLMTLDDYLNLKPSYVVFIIFSGKLYGGADDIFGSTIFENWKKKSSMKNISSIKKKDYLKNYNLENIKKYLLKNSGLYNLALLRIGSKIRAIKSRGTNLDKKTLAKLKNGYRILDQTLEEIKHLANDNNFVPIIVHIPPQSDVVNNYTESRDRLRNFVENTGFSFIDGMNILNTNENFYFPIDGHLNSKGYDYISKAIVKELMGLIRF